MDDRFPPLAPAFTSAQHRAEQAILKRQRREGLQTFLRQSAFVLTVAAICLLLAAVAVIGMEKLAYSQLHEIQTVVN